jgi:hypothetical protein
VLPTGGQMQLECTDQTTAIPVPEGGRAPGWDAGRNAARRARPRASVPGSESARSRDMFISAAFLRLLVVVRIDGEFPPRRA